MSIIGRNILFKNKKVSEPTWGKVLDSVLVAEYTNGASATRYLVQAVVSLKQTESRTSDETMLFLVKPKHIQIIEIYSNN
jgi:hypothetical protein